MLINIASVFGCRSFSLVAALICAGAVAASSSFVCPKKATLQCSVYADEWSLFNEGKNFYDKKNFAQAETLWLEVLKQRNGNISYDRVAMATSHWLGFMYLEKGRLKEALPMLKTAAQLNKNIYGLEHKYTCNALNDFAQAYCGLNQQDKAKRILSELY